MTILQGEQGSAKSTTARLCRELIDPNVAPLRSEPREIRDLMIAATNGWLVAFDNLSKVPPWLSDSLCRLSTGGGFGCRELYENQEEVLFDAQRPTLSTGIEELAVREDLLDWALVIDLPAIPEDRRRPEATFWEEFDRVTQKLRIRARTKAERTAVYGPFGSRGRFRGRCVLATCVPATACCRNATR